MELSRFTSVSASGTGEAARLRLTTRLAATYFLDAISNARGEGHLLDSLLASAIIQANVQPIVRRPELQVAFAQSDDLPPDDLRRPVSMNALANSLKLPFETVRRRVTGMIRTGFCQVVAGGVIVPAAALADPKYYATAYRGFEQLRAFYYQLSDLGLLRDLPGSSVVPSPDTFPVRAAARLTGAYILRVVEALGDGGNLLDGLILFEIFRSNHESLPLEPVGEDPADAPDDEALTPIGGTALAARIGVPAETVRRHVKALIANGSCARARGGLIVPAASRSTSILAPAFEASTGKLPALFTALSQLGVLQVWDSARP